ncbi:MAG: LCP family protein [Eggerthellaceae bacterium]|nr:LCP family protein [Eggerthellaceae bacterium]
MAKHANNSENKYSANSSNRSNTPSMPNASNTSNTPTSNTPRMGNSYRPSSAQGRSSHSSSTFSDPELVRVRKKRKKHGKAKKAILIVLAVIVVLCVAVGAAAALYMNSISDSMKMDSEQQSELDTVLSESTVQEPYYVLLLGSDAREGDTASRSDTMILVRVDANVGKATLVSIPRDTKVEIEGHGTQKINAAYAFGGPAGAVEAVEKMSGIEISHYAEIHFDELEKAVDQLGGIWVDVPVSSNQTGSSHSQYQFDAGMQKMTGEQVLVFARERYGYNEGDFQRAENQRIVVQSLADAVLSLPPTDLPGTVQSLASCISTDYSLNELIELAQTFQSAEHYYFYSAMVPSTTQTIDGVSYAITLEDEWVDMMQMVDTGQDPSKANVLTKDTQAVESEEESESETSSEANAETSSGTASESIVS